MFLSIESWRDSKTLMKTITPVVFPRKSDDLGPIAGYSLILKETYGSDTHVIQTEVVEISSSELRELLPKRGGVGYIADTNYSYIIKHRLYGAKPDWDWLRKRAFAMLDPARIPHVEGCELESLKLATRWGADPDETREAAILHDITKRLSPEENIRILEDNGETVGELEFAGEKLLHARTGAVLAKTEFGASKAVADAINWHTTGKAGMSVLEKILYIADYIEPTRDLDGIGLLRETAYEDIDRAVIMGLQMSIDDMTARGIVPNHSTFDALRALSP
jgi:nicotinate-nucleotide adenylyltransferase